MFMLKLYIGWLNDCNGFWLFVFFLGICVYFVSIVKKIKNILCLNIGYF